MPEKLAILLILRLSQSRAQCFHSLVWRTFLIS